MTLIPSPQLFIDCQMAMISGQRSSGKDFIGIISLILPRISVWSWYEMASSKERWTINGALVKMVTLSLTMEGMCAPAVGTLFMYTSPNPTVMWVDIHMSVYQSGGRKIWARAINQWRFKVNPTVSYAHVLSHYLCFGWPVSRSHSAYLYHHLRFEIDKVLTAKETRTGER